MHAYSDNMGTIGAFAKCLSTTHPLDLVMQAITRHCWHSDVRLEIAHTAGVRNEFADLVSRYNEPQNDEARRFVASLNQANRVQVHLHDLF